MNIETIAIDLLSPDPANARLHDKRNLDAIIGSLRRFGQQKPIVVDSRNIIRAGNGQWLAARKIGWTHIKIVRSELETSELTAYAIADNRTAELADWDKDVLSRMASTGDLDGLGFTAAEIEKLTNDEIPDAKGPSPGLKTSFEVVVECADEAHQKSVFERLRAEGLSCRLFTL